MYVQVNIFINPVSVLTMFSRCLPAIKVWLVEPDNAYHYPFVGVTVMLSIARCVANCLHHPDGVLRIQQLELALTEHAIDTMSLEQWSAWVSVIQQNQPCPSRLSIAFEAVKPS